MPTALQLKLIHVAARQVLGDDTPRYRMLLRNVAGVDSAKDLDNKSFEDVMAVLEDMGFRDTAHAADYWRKRVATRAFECGPRMVRKITELIGDQQYQLQGLCRRFSDHRTAIVSQLTPREAYNLIEMLKAVAARQPAIAAAAEEELPF